MPHVDSYIYIAYGLSEIYGGETDAIAGVDSAIVLMGELLGCFEFLQGGADTWNSVQRCLNGAIGL